MAKRGRPTGTTKTKTWDTDDITLQHLYGLSLFKPEEATPRFGSGVRVPLTVGTFGAQHSIEKGEKGDVTVKREGRAETLPPTLLNLSWHFGYMQWAMDNIATLVRQSKGKIKAGDLDERFYIAAQEFARREFEQKRVHPLRRALLDSTQPVYLYCVPSVSIETELQTGKPLTVEGDRVLCVLPKSLPVARHYGLQEAEIQLLAPQVIWLVRILCSFHVLDTPEKLIDAIDGWVDYLNPGVMEQVREHVAASNPQLLSPKSTKVFLA